MSSMNVYLMALFMALAGLPLAPSVAAHDCVVTNEEDPATVCGTCDDGAAHHHSWVDGHVYCQSEAEPCGTPGVGPNSCLDDELDRVERLVELLWPPPL